MLSSCISPALTLWDGHSGGLVSSSSGGQGRLYGKQLRVDMCQRRKKGTGLLDESAGPPGRDGSAAAHHTRASISKEKQKRLNKACVKKVRKSLWQRCVSITES